MSEQYTFYFDSERCLKCFACEIACQQWHEIKAGTYKLRRLHEITRGSFPDVTRTFVSTACRHCAKAPCAAACLQGAITRRAEDGIVITDSSKCIGCRQCLEACPFGIPEFGDDGTLRKCDMCLDRVQQGQRPVCVSSCPTQALNWGTVREMTALASHKAIQKTAGKQT